MSHLVDIFKEELIKSYSNDSGQQYSSQLPAKEYCETSKPVHNLSQIYSVPEKEKSLNSKKTKPIANIFQYLSATKHLEKRNI